MSKYLLLIMILLCPVVYGQTISQQLQDISDAKAAIKAAIESKGVTVDDDLPLHRYDDSVRDIIIPDAADNVTGYLATDTAKGSIVTVSEVVAYYLGIDTAPPISSTSNDGLKGVALSSDGTRLVFKGRGTGIPIASYNYNSTTGSYEQTEAVSGAVSPGSYYIAMSRDGSTVIVPAAGACGVYTWSSSNNRYELQTSPDTVPVTGYDAAITDDLTRIVVTDANSGVATWVYTLAYSEANGRYEATTPVDTQPTGRAYGVAVSANGDYMAVAHAGTSAPEKLATYKWDSGDGRYELTANHTGSLTGTVIGCAMAADGSVVGVGHNSSPYIVTMAWNAGNNRYEPQSAISFGSFGNPKGSCYALSMADDASIIVGSFATSTTQPVFMVFKWSSDNNRYEAIAAYSHGSYNSATMGAAISGNGLFAASTHTIIDDATAYYAYKIATEGAYLATKHTSPVAPTASVTADCIGYTHAAGSIGQSMTITALYNTNSYIGSDFVFDEPSQTITGYRGTATEITVPSQINGVDVLVIGTSALREKSLTSVTISSGITTINSNAFCDNDIATLSLPNTITTIGTSAFGGNALTSVTLPTSLETLGALAFANNLIASINIPNSVTSMGSYCWWRNKVTDAGGGITIGTGLTALSTGAFSEAAFGVLGITSITIPSNVGTIDDLAFWGAPLTTITMASATTAIYNTGTYTDHRTMGSYGEGFVTAYGTGGVGTYNYSGGVWTKE